MLQQTHTVLNNGLQSFAEASPDYEMAPIGIGSMREQAKKLAEYGRNGDIYVVHAAEGETVIPLEVLESNPKIKELLFGQMRGMGLDPQEFVVGSELNSINPDTGLPEFFFKSVFRGVKKAVKSVAKIAKKVAPIAIPMAAAAFGIPFLGPAFGPGTFGASFIGGGIGSLVGGASLKDSFKAGLISGGLASLTGGLKSKFLEGGDFGAGISRSFTGAGAPSFDLQAERFGSMLGGDTGAAERFFTMSPDQSSLASMGVDSTDDLLSNLGITAPSISAGGGTFSGGSGISLDQDIINKTFPDPSVRSLSFPRMQPGTLPSEPVVSSKYDQFFAGTPMVDTGMSVTNPAFKIPDPLPEMSFLEKTFGPTGKSIDEGLTTAGDYLFRGGDSQKVIDKNVAKATQDYIAGQTALGITPTDVGLQKYIEESGVRPGLLAQYGPTAALALGGAKLGGAFDTPEVEDVTRADLPGFEGPTGYDLFQADPSAFKIADINPYRYDTGNPLVASAYAANGGYIEKPQNMNRGGTPQFPRREMLIEGPGTETSDDIPAMLSDGEFVMNAKAVRGADPSGNGNRQAGAKNLYDMMRNFEMRA